MALIGVEFRFARISSVHAGFEKFEVRVDERPIGYVTNTRPNVWIVADVDHKSVPGEYKSRKEAAERLWA